MDFPTRQQGRRYGAQRDDEGANLTEKHESRWVLAEPELDGAGRADAEMCPQAEVPQSFLQSNYDMRQQKELSWLVKVNTAAEAAYKFCLNFSSADGTISRQLVYLRKANSREIAEMESDSTSAGSYYSNQEQTHWTPNAGDKRRAEDGLYPQCNNNADSLSRRRGEHKMMKPVIEYSGNAGSSFWDDFCSVNVGESSEEQNQPILFSQKSTSCQQQQMLSFDVLSDPLPSSAYSTGESIDFPVMSSSSTNITPKQSQLYPHGDLYSNSILQDELFHRHTGATSRLDTADLRFSMLRGQPEDVASTTLVQGPPNDFARSFIPQTDIHRFGPHDFLLKERSFAHSSGYSCRCPQCSFRRGTTRFDPTRLTSPFADEIGMQTFDLMPVMDWDVPLGYTREGTTGLRMWREIRGERRRLDIEEAEELIAMHRKKVMSHFKGHKEKVAPTFLKECKHCIAGATHVWTRQVPYGIGRQTFWCLANLEDIQKDVNTKRAKITLRK